MDQTRKVSIIGASGYSGAELVSVLLKHSGVKIDKLFASGSAGKRVDDVYPRFAGTIDAAFEAYSASAACSSDLVFLALPSGEAMNIVPELLERGKRVIDLGGDFRIQDPVEYERYYKQAHSSVHLLPQAVYGLPEWNREAIRGAKLVANPGCYPTGALLPLLPLLKEGTIAPRGVVVNSLSGVSGAGRKAAIELSYVEVNESVRAYKVGTHQHIPEIKSILQHFTGHSVSLSFVPHLLPLTRGIYTSAYAPLQKAVSAEYVTDVFTRSYAKEPFIRFSPSAIPEIRNVRHTNYVDIGVRVDSDNNQLILFSAIDNLVKGAAGQAVQNMNLMLGYPETEGLL
ncbi:MAG: N-acetyl-gamma-glutamyl-phosphate reductase [Ignavibacteriales bacterium]|nr:N-acetyl-gamma-glutamyl-phosphate reductase [Ignavibacteriales bacterium]